MFDELLVINYFLFASLMINRTRGHWLYMVVLKLNALPGCNGLESLSFLYRLIRLGIAKGVPSDNHLYRNAW